MIKRESILGMIGAEKYHSCICTTYSFDFLYFEMKVMRALTGAGVQNVTVLVDGKYYGTMMENPTLREYTINNRYALHPVFSQGIFHPKIMILFGKKEGLLIVGSGNLTSSGMGGNDEVWGAFHYSPTNPQYAGLFKMAWAYLQRFTKTSEGIIQLKTQEWIERNTPWINELPDTKYGELIDYGRGQSLAFLWQQKGLSLYQQLQKQLSHKTVQKIAVVSPYYDKEGLVLDRYLADFSPKQIQVVLDESGLLPMDFKPSKQYSFYPWKDISGGTAEEQRRLHGKLHHFACRDGSEYLFFGSANATPEGLGLKSISHEEAGFLMYSQTGGLLNKVGIDFTKADSRKLSEFTPAFSSPMNSATGLTTFRYKIKSAEIAEEGLSVYLSDECSESVQLVVYSQSGKIIMRERVSEPRRFFQIKMESDTPPHTLQLFSANGQKPVSQRVVIHDVLQMLKTNPDPKTKNFDIAISEIKNVGDSSMIVELLHYVLDESLDTEPLIVRQYVAGFSAEKKTPEQDTELKDIKTFTVEQQVSHHRALMLSPSVSVADLLKFAFNPKHTSREQDVREDEQQTDADAASGMDDENQVPTIPSQLNVRSERQKILKYFERLTDHYYDRCFDTSQSENKVGISDLSRFVIALNLLEQYTGKVVPGVMDGDQMFCYVKEDSEYSLYDNLKWLMLGLTGWLLQLCIRGTQNYEYDYTKRKWDELKHDALLKTVVLLCRIAWKKQEEASFLSLMLNTLVYLGSKSESGTVIKAVLQHIENAKNKPATSTNRFKENCHLLFSKIIPTYERLTANLSRPVDQRQFVTAIKTGDVIYSSRFGIGHVTDVQRNGTSPVVGFIRPGLEWNDDLDCFRSLQIKGQTKFIPVLISENP